MTIHDKQLKNKTTVKFCKNCVLSNQRPRIKFNEKGICSACEYAVYKQNNIDWDFRESQLIKLLNLHRSSNGSFDCIVPCSGGKDGSVVAHQLKYKYNMNPLTVTWAPFIHSDIGWKNFMSFTNSGFDNLLCTPNGNLYRKLSRLGFEFVGDNFLPFIYGQLNYPFHISIKHKIPLIFYGENGELEYGGTAKDIEKPYRSADDFTEEFCKGVDIDELIQVGLDNKILEKNDIIQNSLQYFKVPKIDDINKNNSQQHWFSYYKKWDPQENFYYASDNVGFSPNNERSEGTYSKYASIDDKTDAIHYYLGLIKFGMGRATSDAAHEIRDNHITREEGKLLVKKFDQEFPQKGFREFIKYVDISEEHFHNVIQKYQKNSTNIWKKINDKWYLRHTVTNDGVDDNS